METQQQAATSAITHKDILIMKLKSDVQLSREHQRDVAKQLQDCESTIAELQGEIADFQGIVSMRVAETKNKEQSIQILEQLYKSSRGKVIFWFQVQFTVRWVQCMHLIGLSVPFESDTLYRV